MAPGPCWVGVAAETKHAEIETESGPKKRQKCVISNPKVGENSQQTESKVGLKWGESDPEVSLK